MKTLLLLTLASAGYGQTLTISGPATVKPGAPVDLAVTLTGGSNAMTVIQWTMSLPPGAMMGTPTTTVLGASVACTPTPNVLPGPKVCLLSGYHPETEGGVTSLLVPDGIIAKIPVTLPTVPANLTVAIEGVLATNTASRNVPVTIGPVATIEVLPSPCDLNRDGKIDASDAFPILLYIIRINEDCGISAERGGCNLFTFHQVILAIRKQTACTL